MFPIDAEPSAHPPQSMCRLSRKDTSTKFTTPGLRRRPPVPRTPEALRRGAGAAHAVTVVAVGGPGEADTAEPVGLVVGEVDRQNPRCRYSVA